MNYTKFHETVWKFYKENKRSFPWRETHEFYNILVSEIMLQQTQVTRVTYKYQEFLDKFPTLKDLARAPLRDVLHTWMGLGYNRRAKALHECAKQITEKHKGQIPKTFDELVMLPGIGQSTAGALLNFVWNIPTPFIETNIRTVYLHHFFKNSKNKIDDKKILDLVSKTIDTDNPREWFYALYDYGTHLKQNLKQDPARKSTSYKKQSKFKGSFREKRAFVLKLLLNKKLRETEIGKRLLDKKLLDKKDLKEETLKIISSLLEDNLILKSKGFYFV